MLPCWHPPETQKDYICQIARFENDSQSTIGWVAIGQGHHWSAWADESGPERHRISVKLRTVRANVTSVADGVGEGVPGFLQIWASNRRRPLRQLAPCRLQAQNHMDEGRRRRALQDRALESPRRRRRTLSSIVCRRTCQRHRHSLTRSRLSLIHI